MRSATPSSQGAKRGATHYSLNLQHACDLVHNELSQMGLLQVRVISLFLYGWGEKPEMTALFQALSQAFGADAETESLKIVAIFSGLGALISLLWVLFFLTYGLDLSSGFF